MLDLSQFASQNFRFVSEDLEIKSNTPQVGEVQEATLTQHKRVELRGKAVERQQTSKPLIQDVQPCACHVTRARMKSVYARPLNVTQQSDTVYHKFHRSSTCSFQGEWDIFSDFMARK